MLDHLADVVRAADDRDHRPERLLVHQFGRRAARGRPRSADRARPAGCCRAGAWRPSPPRRSTRRSNDLRRALVDHGADVGRRVHRVAGLELLRLREHELGEFVRDLVHHQDALHRRAALAGVLGRAGDRKLGRLVEVGVLHDDQRIVAAKLQHDAAVAGLVGDVLADLHRARERDQVAVRVGDHGVAHGGRIAGHDREHLGRQARPRTARRRAPARSAASVRSA